MSKTARSLSGLKKRQGAPAKVQAGGETERTDRKMQLEELQGLATERSAVPKSRSSVHTLHPSSLQSSLSSLHSQLLSSQLRLSSAVLHREAAVQRLQEEGDKLVEVIHLAQERSQYEESNVREIGENVMICEEEVRVWEGTKASYVGEYEEIEEKIRDFRRKQTDVDCERLIPALRDLYREGGDNLETIRRKIEDCEGKIAEIELEKQKIKANLSKNADKDIAAFESNIRTALSSTPSFSFPSLIELSFLSSHYNLHESILQAQFQVLSTQVPTLEYSSSLSILAYQEQLIDSNDDAKVRERALKEGKRNKLRLAAVDRWRREAVEVLRGSEGRSVPVGDDLVLEKVNSLLASHPNRVQLMHLFEDYSKALSSQEARYSTPSVQSSLQRCALLSTQAVKTREQLEYLRVRMRRIEVSMKGKEAGKRILANMEISEEARNLANMLIQRSIHTESRLSASLSELHRLSFQHACLVTQYSSSKQRLSAFQEDLDTAEKKLKAVKRELETNGNRGIPTSEEVEAHFALISTQKAITLTTQQLETLQSETARFDSQSTSPMPITSLHSRSDITRSPIRKREGQEVSPISSGEKEELMGLLEGAEWRLEDCITQPELITRLRPLLTGSSLYKKFSQNSSLRLPCFDPLLAQQYSPEVCGYGLRTFRLNPSLADIEIRHGFRVESTIPLSKLRAVLIPRSTMSVIKTQKKGLGRRSEKPQGAERLYRSMKAGGVIDTESLVYEALCAGCDLYPFYFLLEESGRMDVIARGYEVFREWVLGANAVIRRKGELESLARRVRG